MPSYDVEQQKGVSPYTADVNMLTPGIFYLSVGQKVQHGEPARTDIQGPAIVIANTDNPGALRVRVSQFLGKSESCMLVNGAMVTIPLKRGGLPVTVDIDRGGRVTHRRRLTVMVDPPRVALPG